MHRTNIRTIARTIVRPIAFAALALGMSVIAAAETSPEDAVKYRQSIMKALSGHNGAIALIVRGKAGDADQLTNHVAAIVNLTAEVGAVFESGANVEDSEALPAIWEDPDAFAAAVTDFEAAVAALSDAAGSGDMEVIAAAHKELGAACKACHEDFRQKDE